MISALDTSSRAAVSQSILAASSATGVGFDYLMRTAMRESSMDPQAKAKTSSASGLYQFVDQTWLSMIEKHGSKYGLETYVDAIDQKSSGRFKVDDPALKSEILALRHDPEIASLMAGELARENRASLEEHLGRGVSDGEVYAAHFLGTTGAISLLSAAQSDPQASAADLLPAAAKANKSIFYAEDGSARSIAQVVGKVTHLPEAEMPEMILASASVPAAVLTKPAAEPIVFPVPTAELRGTLEASPSDVAESRTSTSTSSTGQRVYGAMASLPLVLSPGVIEILSSLNPLPDRAVWNSLFTQAEAR